MAVPDLNEDILTVICDFLDNVSDVCAISLASSSFRPVAIRRLLSICPAQLTSGVAIRRFHTFLFADVAARAPLVRALDIEPGSFQPSEVSLLVDILASCQHLERISWRRDTSAPRLTEYPGVIDAIASMQGLRSLSFQSPAVDALALARRISAPLRTLGLWCFYKDESELDSDVEFSWHPAAFQDSLSHLAPTLEDLGFHELIVDPEKIQELQESESESEDPAPPLSTSISSWTQYPAVRSLSVNYFTGKLLLEPLQHLFPALDGTLTISQTDLGCSEDEFIDMRAANQNQRAQEGARHGGWTKFDRVECTTAAFYLLGLRCPIRRAVLDAGDGYYGSEFLGRCAAVALCENPVPHLTLSLGLDEGLGVLDGLFGPELGGTLTGLTLVLDTVGHWPAEPAPVPFGWGELLDRTLSALRPLHKLTHLRLVFHSESPEDSEPETDAKRGSGTSAPPTPTPVPAEDPKWTLHWSLFDFEGSAAAAVRALPSLQALFLTTCGYFVRRVEAGGAVTAMEPTSERWSISRAWRVNVVEASLALDGVPTLVELRDEVADAIIEREELVLPDAYKVWFSKDED